MDTTHYAHTAKDRSWEPLDAHLLLVSSGDPADPSFPGAAGFAEAFGARELGEAIGLLHDLGKYSDDFQAYLNGLGRRGSVDHSTAGAQHAAKRYGPIGRLIAYCVAGHHGGLPDDVDVMGERDGLEDRLRKPVPPIDAAPEKLLGRPQPPLPRLRLADEPDGRAFQASVLCRMLFSCLVDADWLATERFMTPDRAKQRPSGHPRMAEMLEALNRHLTLKMLSAEDTLVNRLRRGVLESCRAKARESPGLFSLTVPTGGGKTLSSIAFALAHAAEHGLRRVIYAIPFTNIIEQNAKVFRDVLGAGAVLEHHSSLDPSDIDCRTRLATENWDAPLVVTTNVQLLESLFASRGGQCRKLHRVARSVIVLDEAQTLPVEVLRPTLAILGELVRNYGCSVVLCTATQPAIVRRGDFPIGLEGVTEIAADPAGLFAAFAVLRRTEVRMVGSLPDEELANRIAGHERVLCIVNNRRHAAALWRMLDGNEGVFHLSARMCPRHRSAVLRLIRRRLGLGLACRVVSTPVIEAGVDIDFPVVYRAMAGLDSIVQASGRCNREGKLASGIVYVFEADSESTTPAVGRAAQDAREILLGRADPLSPAVIDDYFSLHFWKQSGLWDKYGVMSLFSMDRDGLRAQFRQASEKYRIINDAQISAIVPYGPEGRRLCEELLHLHDPPGWELRRRLQRFIVGVHPDEYWRLVERGAVIRPFEGDGISVLADRAVYDRGVGLVLGERAARPD